MKRALFWFLLLAALLPAYAAPTSAEPTCSTNCVSVEQRGNFAVVTGYNAEGVEIYMETVSIDGETTQESGRVSLSDKKLKAITRTSQSTSIPLVDGASLQTTVTTFTESDRTLIIIVNAIYNTKNNLYAVDLVKKRARI